MDPIYSHCKKLGINIGSLLRRKAGLVSMQFLIPMLGQNKMISRMMIAILMTEIAASVALQTDALYLLSQSRK